MWRRSNSRDHVATVPIELLLDLPQCPPHDVSPLAAAHPATTLETQMPKFMLKINYTVDGAKGVIKDGGSARRAVAQKAAESVGGRVEAFYFAFGDTDAYVIGDFPDAASAAAIAMTVSASGGASAQTVVLLTPEEMDGAARKSPMYTAPGR
jgi:uncharacterized protein with GYD domain